MKEQDEVPATADDKASKKQQVGPATKDGNASKKQDVEPAPADDKASNTQDAEPATSPASSRPPVPRPARHFESQLARHRQTLLDPHCCAWNANRQTLRRSGALGRPCDGAHPVAGGVPSHRPLHELIINVLGLSMIGPWAGGP